MASRVVLIVGERDGGKTTRLLSYLEARPDLDLCGFVSLANNEKTCYRLKDLRTGEERVSVCGQDRPGAWRWGRFFVVQPVFDWANRTIVESLGHGRCLVFDEIGGFELAGRGFDPSFAASCEDPGSIVVATVRTPFLDRVVERYRIGRESLSVIRCERPGRR